MHWLSSYWPRTYVLVGVTAFVVAVVLMPLAIRLFKRLHILDAVKPDKLHHEVVPRGGGVIMFVAFAAAVILPG